MFIDTLLFPWAIQASDIIIILEGFIFLDHQLAHLRILLFLLLFSAFVFFSLLCHLLPFAPAESTCVSSVSISCCPHHSVGAHGLLLSISPSLCPLQATGQARQREFYYYHNAHNYCVQQMHLWALFVYTRTYEFMQPYLVGSRYRRMCLSFYPSKNIYPLIFIKVD